VHSTGSGVPLGKTDLIVGGRAGRRLCCRWWREIFGH